MVLPLYFSGNLLSIHGKDMILIMGAGDINIICENLFLELLNNKSITNNLAA